MQNEITQKVNESTLRLCECVQSAILYKYDARALLSHILSILNSDLLHHGYSVHGVYEYLVLTPPPPPTPPPHLYKNLMLDKLQVLYKKILKLQKRSYNYKKQNKTIIKIQKGQNIFFWIVVINRKKVEKLNCWHFTLKGEVS